jgi:hypothetical protein
MLLLSSGPSLNVALTVGAISATGVASDGFSNSGKAHPLRVDRRQDAPC